MSDGTLKSMYEFTRILVIEDETHTRMLICRLLRQIGFTLIDEAKDGMEGFHELLRVKPAIILCDINMKPVDGMAFLKRLRGLSKPEYSEIPVVFLTADGHRNTVMTARELRIDGYLVKPISLSALKDRIDFILRSSDD